MYPRNAASPERIAIGPVLLIADGTPQSSGVTVTVRGQGGAEAGSAGTIAYGATGVIVYYTPTQGETDFTSFTVTASKSACIPVCVTVITSASATPGYAGTDQGKIANPTATVALTGTTVGTITTYTGNTVQTGDAFARIGVAGAGLTAIVTTGMTEAYAADGAAFSLAQGIYMIWALLAERSRVTTTLTAKKLDGSTAAMTFTLDSATAPTSQTRAT